MSDGHRERKLFEFNDVLVPAFFIQLKSVILAPAVHCFDGGRPLGRHTCRRRMIYMRCWLSHDTGTTHEPTTSKTSR